MGGPHTTDVHHASKSNQPEAAEEHEPLQQPSGKSAITPIKRGNTMRVLVLLCMLLAGASAFGKLDPSIRSEWEGFDLVVEGLSPPASLSAFELVSVLLFRSSI